MSACPTCGSDPCGNPSFCAACREADQRKARGENPRYTDPAMWKHPRDQRDWDGMSLEQLWDLFNRERPTSQTTVEAIIHCVRERGLGALKEPANFERLSCCDEAAKTEINRRIASLIAAKEIAA